MNFHILSSFAFGSLALGACASTPGAQPSDMSVAKHEQAAGAAETQATAHQAQFDPGAPAKSSNCDGQVDTTCWLSESNPTAQHRRDGESYHKMAVDHRAGAQSLRDAETRACGGVTEKDRDVSPFFHRQDIVSVESSSKSASPYDGHENPSLVSGAVVTFRANPGMTVEWLQRVVDCHIARNSSVGNEMPEMGYCPLAVKGATATVSSAHGAFAVTIDGSNPASIKEVIRRAQALKNPG